MSIEADQRRDIFVRKTKRIVTTVTTTTRVEETIEETCAVKEMAGGFPPGTVGGDEKAEGDAEQPKKQAKSPSQKGAEKERTPPLKRDVDKSAHRPVAAAPRRKSILGVLLSLDAKSSAVKKASTHETLAAIGSANFSSRLFQELLVLGHALDEWRRSQHHTAPC